MSIHELGTFTMSPAAGAVARLIRDSKNDAIPMNKKVRALLMDVQWNSKNNTGAGQTMQYGDYTAALSCMYDKFSTAFGLKQKEVVDQSLAFNQLRLMTRRLSGKDVMLFNGTDYVEASTITPSATFGSAIAAGASTSLRALVLRPYEMRALSAEDQFDRCPGRSQMNQLELEIKRGSDFSTYNANRWIQDGLVTFTLFADCVDSRQDDWQPVPRLFTTDLANKKQWLPGGTLLELINTNTAFASTLLQLVTVRADDTELIRSMPPTRLQQINAYNKIEGFESIADEYTPIILLPPNVRLQDLPLASRYVFEQEGTAAVAQAQTTMLYIPYGGADFVEAGAKNLANEKINDGDGDEKMPLLVNADVVRNANTPANRAATAGFSIIPPEHRDFRTLPGLKVKPKGGTKVSVPISTLAQAQAAKGGASKEAQGSVIRAAGERIAKFLPGFLQPKRGGQQEGGATVVRDFGLAK